MLMMLVGPESGSGNVPAVPMVKRADKGQITYV